MTTMIDVGLKPETRRRAVASGALRMSQEAYELTASGRLPKGDALAVGQVAGILAAKRTPEAIPLCHPITLESVAVRFTKDPELPGIRCACEVVTSAKTGVEMEALSGVTGALLAVWDLVKQVDPALRIEDVRLDSKEGGRSGHWMNGTPSSIDAEPAAAAPLPELEARAVVITVSDRCAAGETEDLSGPALADGLRAFGLDVRARTIVADERPEIEAAIRVGARTADVVVLTGGTGLSPRDVTPEAVEAACARMIPGVGEALRAAGAAKTPMAPLSRSCAGQLGKALVVALPGSPGGVRDGLAVLARVLPHALHVAQGGGHS